MTSELSSVSIILVVAAPSLLFLMLLPTLLELRKPRDAGPRRIMDDLSWKAGVQGWPSNMRNMEKLEKFDAGLVVSLGKLFAVLPNLDS